MLIRSTGATLRFTRAEPVPAWASAPLKRNPRFERLVAGIRPSLRGTCARYTSFGPGHCTGEPGFAALRARFGAAYLDAGLGTVLERAAGDSAQWERGGAPMPN